MVKLENKIVGVQSLKKKLSAVRKQGKTIVFTNGCFDLMHLGHVKYLQAAKSANAVVVVGLNSDRSIKRIKGPSRPIVAQRSRAAVLAALESVDFVVIFNEETPYALIKAVQPDILVKGADWKGKKVVGADVAKKLRFIKYEEGFSTTNIIERVLKAA